jgi:hypothetical protein
MVSKSLNSFKKSLRSLKIKPSEIKFKDYPEFTPNLTPIQIFKLGSFGGTYWRPIYSSVTKKNYKNVHKNYIKTNCISSKKTCSSFNAFHTLPTNYLVTPFKNYDNSINFFKVKVGTTLKYWEKKKWINKLHPYGWVQWYCDFYLGKRSSDDDRQIKRWNGIAGPKGRFKLYLKTLIKKSKLKKRLYKNKIVSPKIRQTLLHWGVLYL